MKRRHNWPSRLHECIRRWRRRPFEPGRTDCALFAAACVAAQTGVYPGRPFSGRYSTLAEGEALVLEEAGGLMRLARSWLGRPLSASQARQGDVVMARDTLEPALGICVDHRAAFLTVPSGIRFVPVSQCSVCWRVGS